ncbi:hypothetical protein COP2_011608 [Malus domestica]
MKYFCFRRSGGDLTALHSEALLFGDGAVNMLLKLLELLDSTQTPSAGLVDCAGKWRLDLEGNQHITSTCFKVSFSLALSVLQENVASSSKVHQQLKTSTREQFQVSNQAKVPGSRFFTRSLSGGSDILLSLSLSLQVRTRTNEKTGRKHDTRYSCFLPGDMRYFYFGVICLQGYSRIRRKLSISRGSTGSVLLEMRKGWVFLQVCLAMEDEGRHI